MDGILVPGGFGDRGIEGKILAAEFARVNNIPYFGICLGMQMAVIEFARNILNLKNANSSEMDSSTKHPIINLMDDQVEIDAHYSGYLKRQSHDIAAFKKDEGIKIPDKINYDIFSGLSNEIKSKLKIVRPKTLGQALRIDGVTPAAAIILSLIHI